MEIAELLFRELLASSEAPVEFARPLPTAPVPPVFDWLPRTRAVKGDPELAEIPPAPPQAAHIRRAIRAANSGHTSETAAIRLG